jgi:hypothetical protein
LAPATSLAKFADGMALSGDDGKTLSPDDARAAIEKEAARITSDILPLLERLGIH